MRSQFEDAGEYLEMLTEVKVVSSTVPGVSRVCLFSLQREWCIEVLSVRTRVVMVQGCRSELSLGIDAQRLGFSMVRSRPCRGRWQCKFNWRADDYNRCRSWDSRAR